LLAVYLGDNMDFVAIISGLVVAALAGVANHLFKMFFYDGQSMRIGLSPNVAGEYRTVYKNRPEDWSETVIIKQFGKRLWGESKDNDSHYSVKIKGTVTPSRLIYYNFRHQDDINNDCGVGMLKLDKYGAKADGYVIFLDDDSDVPTSVEITMIKIP